MQLNALNRLNEYIGNKEMEILINSFIYSDFNYCLLAGILALVNQHGKVRKSTNV